MIPSWIQNLVGIPYRDNGETLDGFNCTGLARYIYRQLNKELPDSPVTWRQTFKRLGWPSDINRYDLFVMDNPDPLGPKLHMAVAVDKKELIHARSVCKQVVIEPIVRFSPYIRTSFRLR